MLGCAIVAAAAAGLFIAAKRRRYRRLAYYYGYGGPCGGPGPWGYDAYGPGFGRAGFAGHEGHFHRRWRSPKHGILRGLFMRLDTTPGQEKAIVSALDGARERLSSFKLGFKDSRRDIAALIGSDVFDRAAFEALLAEHKATLDQMSNEFLNTVATIHDALDTRQRRELGALLADGSLGHALRPRWMF